MALLKSVLPWVLIIAIKLYVLWASVNLINMDELSPWKLGESSTVPLTGSSNDQWVGNELMIILGSRNPHM